jgi:phosphate transport system substrate-binding protein
MNIVINIRKLIIIAFHNVNSDSASEVIRKHIRNKKIFLQFLALAAMTLLAACNRGPKVFPESPTRGNIRIIADESFQPLIDAEVSTFTQLYQNAIVKPTYKPEVDIINDFMNDSAKVIVSSKKLTDDQIQFLRDTLIIARTTTFAYDALALITNKNNRDTILRYKTVKDIFLGEATTWKDINPKSKLGEIKVVFDNTKSGNIRYFKELFEIRTGLPYNFYAMNNNAEVVDYVSRNPEALGIISVNWISDRNDPQSLKFLDKVNVVGVSQPMTDNGSYYRPHQGFIYTKEYPFVREIYFISRETFKGLGSGFIQWATAEQGQRIVLKSGLVPATMPIRIVQLKTQ